jgi:hypothetical protein
MDASLLVVMKYAQSCRAKAPAQVLAEPGQVFDLQGNLAKLSCHA